MNLIPIPRFLSWSRFLLLFFSCLHHAVLSVLSLSNAPPLVSLDAFGHNSIRVRMAPSGGKIVDPPIRSLLPQAPPLTKYSAPSIQSALFTGRGKGKGKGGIVNHSAHAETIKTSLTNGNLRIDVNEHGLLTATRISNNKRLLQQTSVKFGSPLIQGAGLNNDSVSGIITFAGSIGEEIYGLGEHRNGKLNQMGFVGDSRDSQYYPTSSGGDILIPYYASSLGYAFMCTTASMINVSLTEQELVWGIHAAANIDIWISTTSANMDTESSYLVDLLNNYADVVGHASPMPYYVSGFWQCKLRYRSQNELLQVVREYIKRQLPLSIIVVDFFHWQHFGDWSFNPICWPNVTAMVDELNGYGVELAVSFWPFVTQNASHYQEFMVDHTYVWTDRTTGKPLPLENWEDPSGMYLVDETEEEVRKAMFNAFWEGYGQYGVRTLWLDAAEPERFGSPNYGAFKTISHGTDMEVGMSWVRFHAQAIYEGFLQHGYTTDDFFTLSRSSWSGTGSYSNGVWSGDIQSSFEELTTAIRIAQSFALSGQVLWTTDIGGFCCGDQNDPVFQELIVRWFQFGAFCPLFRLHGSRKNAPPDDECGFSGGDNEIWALAKDEIHYNAMATMMRLREQLRQYVIATNKQSVETGIPMIRPLFLQFPNDPECKEESNFGTYMFGDKWLVSPVTAYNTAKQSVYLPLLSDENERWIYYFNQSLVYQGGQYVDLETPISEFPLFFRDSNIVTMSTWLK